MKALILAAGEGTRLRPLTTNIPKPLLTVAGRPYLAHLVQALRDAGIQEQVILVGWKANRVKEFFGDGKQMGVELSYLEQKERLGTANAIGVAEGLMDGDFVCVNGDVVMAPEAVAEMVSEFRKDRRPFMGVVEVPEPQRFGVVQHDNGISTLYAHMNSRAVSEGDVVSQGQVLGYVGTTGSSTGNHLHLEVWVNGTRTDALDYYPALAGQFTYR